ncbi:ribosome biogenesis protein tsr1 [Cylindrobasidium torrendii FP15055 ss-10]|uniref:Ribosome biogenesis protein tsr1 n=1 Tax=Cylindrobasidium torrendii FP15055 ss-10 TaxID=1314674 RepID=A0A0D7BJ76_9AGAR|nr:ribosome biogenesis protein tsr1 [Cylindrobasidium torrendii FP15055 ss-10]
MGEFHHRATLKQSNKAFKSKHASKSSLREAAKGRVQRQSPKSSPTQAATQARVNRKNTAKQHQIKKRHELVSSTRIFNGVDGAPRIVAVIPLTPDVSAQPIVSLLAGSLDIPTDDYSPLWRVNADRFKTSAQFLSVPYRQMYAALDAAKVADYVVLVLSTNVEVDTWGETLLRTLDSQGMPKVVAVVAPNADLDAKTRPDVLKSLLSFTKYFAPSLARVYDMHSHSDCLNAMRALCEGKPDEVRWRKDRSWVLGERSEWQDGVLAVTGVVRGAPLSANRLMHIPNVGDLQIAKIMSAPLPRHTKGAMDVEPTLLAEPDEENADSLVAENEPDDMANEQTWPTEEEMNAAAHARDGDGIPDAINGTTPKAIKRRPKGMSEYQAAWIVEDDDEAAEDGDQEGDDDGMEDEDEPAEVEDEDAAMEVESRRSVGFEDLDVEEEAKQLDSWRKREREEEDDLKFPDEIDTPQEVAARVRFQRFRGMRSFRTSPWDAYENLPRDYARLFQFEDYKRTERNVRRRAEEDIAVVQPGTRVTIYLKDVPKSAVPSGPFAIFSVLQHEHKMTVLNFTLQRNTEFDGSIRSKDPLIMCIGARRLKVQPIYSQHTRGGGTGPNNVHKFERYLRHGGTYVATVYAPVVFGPLPAVFLQETEDVQAPALVATGTFLNPDTTRVIAKRAILTGHPFKVHKKTATVRYMFFNPEDIAYFKPVQLHTKQGRAGHIKESLGTHGYFKAYFDGPISQMDTVCMSLYKRVYPKWATLWKEENDSGDAMAIEA